MQQITSPSSVSARPFQPSAWLGDAWRSNRPLTVVAVFSTAAFLVALVALVVSPAQVLNEPAWLKPAKFGISIALYCFTFIWLLSFVRNAPRTVRIVSWVTAVAFVVEIVVIFLQASRGVRSHFNVSTAFDAAMFGLMGNFILALWIASMVAAVLLLRQRMDDPVMAHALRLGLVLAVLGSGIGALMTMPTSEQAAEMAATGQALPQIGAHSVGVADGGEGLPIVGWSTEGGDLRVPHFIGLHAMQIVPLVGIFLTRQRRQGRRRSMGEQVGLVWLAGLSYLGVLALTLQQALRGQPLLQPDAWTAAAGVILLVATGAALAAILSGRSLLRSR